MRRSDMVMCTTTNEGGLSHLSYIKTRAGIEPKFRDCDTKLH